MSALLHPVDVRYPESVKQSTPSSQEFGGRGGSGNTRIRIQRQYNTEEEVRSDIGRPCWDCECPSGFIPHPWRKTCGSCKCAKDSHDLFHDEWLNIRDQLGVSGNATDPFQRLSIRPPAHNHQGYTWAPPTLSTHQISDFYKEYPADKVPKCGTAGETYRDRQILHQIPKQDLAIAYCKHVDKEHHSAYEDFVNTRNEIALDVGFVAPVVIPDSGCVRCGVVLEVGQLGVFAPKFGEGSVWHPACFSCNSCDQFLVDLTYCKVNEGLFCERHYAQEIHPRCAACDEVMNQSPKIRLQKTEEEEGQFRSCLVGCAMQDKYN